MTPASGVHLIDLQLSIEYDLSLDLCSYDRVGKDAAELLGNVEGVHCGYLWQHIEL